MVHMFWYVLQVALDTAWCPPGAAGDEPDTGLGLLQHLPLSTKLNPRHLPSCQEERGAGTPRAALTNIPQQVQSCCQAAGRG